MKRLTYVALRYFSALQHFLRERLTNAGWLIAAAAATAAGLGIDTTRTMSYQAFAFLAALLGVAFIAARFFRAQAAVERELPRYVTAGERFEYRLLVRNRGRRSAQSPCAKRYATRGPAMTNGAAPANPARNAATGSTAIRAISAGAG